MAVLLVLLPIVMLIRTYIWKDEFEMAAEKDFENQIKQWFHTVGVYPAGYPEDRMKAPQVGWYTKVWGGGYQKAGIPDIICCIQGEFVAVEVKAENGRPSELQLLNVERIEKAGGYCRIVYPEDFQTFKKEILNIIKKGN